MDKIILMLITISVKTIVFAQTDVNIKLNHHFDGSTFNYGDQYTDDFGNLIEISRVQYYLTGFNLMHDGGISTPLGDSVILASANISDYSLCDMNISNMEAIDFDLGIDQARNHLDPASYPTNHPLNYQNPNMHWGWTAGYKFLVIEGMADSDGDQVPDAIFQFHVTGSDAYLINVAQMSCSDVADNDTLDIIIDVNIADWISGIDLSSAGFLHGVYPDNGTVMKNTNDHLVFTTSSSTASTIEKSVSGNISVDYSLPYAPTIFYKFPTASHVDLTITDINGRVVISETSLPKAANYFIEKELAAGTYIAAFASNGETIKTERFIVSK